jgi:DNA ligase-1
MVANLSPTHLYISVSKFKMATFPKLIGEAKSGKTKVWSIEVVEIPGGGSIVSRHGYEGGVIQMEEKEVIVGKNIGKKNETTALQQAIQDARTTWTKKIASGYKEVMSGGGSNSSSSAVATKSLTESRASVIDAEIPMPMLAHKLSDKKKHAKMPCFGQPKFDGTRSVALCGLAKGSPCLFSRQRKAYPHLEHIQAVLQKLPKGLVLDGELYTTKHKFQKIVGLVKQKTIKEEDKEKHNDIQLHVYDIIDAVKTFEERFAILEKLFRDYGSVIGSVLQLCPTVKITKESDLKVKHDEYVAAGYEGLMIRNPAGLYAVGQRSADLLKMKEFEDDEFEVVDFYTGEGREEGCVMWRCKTKDGKVFGCRPEGTHEERAVILRDAASYIGKMLTVRYQELTGDGLPRFPVGIAFRDYE